MNIIAAKYPSFQVATESAASSNADLVMSHSSFGTKIDTLARHVLWLRENDPGAKSVIFSQYKDFLQVLSRAFTQFRIAYSNFDKPNGVKKFKDDPGVRIIYCLADPYADRLQIECFFLHAKAQASGLNLVNATHVFLCEPLINTAIELQAIARVHRIGQHNPTTVCGLPMTRSLFQHRTK